MLDVGNTFPTGQNSKGKQWFIQNEKSPLYPWSPATQVPTTGMKDNHCDRNYFTVYKLFYSKNLSNAFCR